MAVQLEKIVPFGRSLAEYQRMFLLSAADFEKKIVGVGDGPASFNAELRWQGIYITSIDPLYQFSGEDIQQQFDRVVEDIITQVKATPADWNWSWHGSPDRLRELRQEALQHFLADYDLGKQENRYQVGALPALDFPDRSFDLALCSHLLFLYSDHLSYEFHYSAIAEMLRIAQEVRIFPLLTLDLRYSPYLGEIISQFRSQGYQVTIHKAFYELQKGGNEMIVFQQ